MITEHGRIIAIDANHVWVETINRGTCGSCAAEKGCGQSLLARWLSHSQYLKVSIAGRDTASFAINDEICIGVPENVVVLSSLLVYCLPIGGLIVGATLGQILFANDIGAIACAAFGLGIGAAIVRFFTHFYRNHRGIQPVIVDLIGT